VPAGAAPAGAVPERSARAVALEALGRIGEGGAYANLVLPAVLAR